MGCHASAPKGLRCQWTELIDMLLYVMWFEMIVSRRILNVRNIELSG